MLLTRVWRFLFSLRGDGQVREEIRLLRHDTTKRREELMALHLELEEAHVELDNVNVLGMEGTEGLHRNELNTAERDVANMWQRRIRMERCRWKIRNFRKNVLLRRLMKRYIAPVRKRRQVYPRIRAVLHGLTPRAVLFLPFAVWSGGGLV